MTLAVNSFKTVDRVANSVSDLATHIHVWFTTQHCSPQNFHRFCIKTKRTEGTQGFFNSFSSIFPSLLSIYPISNPLSFIPLSAQRKSQLQVLTHSCHHIGMLDFIYSLSLHRRIHSSFLQ